MALPWHLWKVWRPHPYSKAVQAAAESIGRGHPLPGLGGWWCLGAVLGSPHLLLGESFSVVASWEATGDHKNRKKLSPSSSFTFLTPTSYCDHSLHSQLPDSSFPSAQIELGAPGPSRWPRVGLWGRCWPLGVCLCAPHWGSAGAELVKKGTATTCPATPWGTKH